MENNINSFSVIGDERGNLVSLEEYKNVPFSIKRVYYLYELKKELSRGFHAHKELQQVLVCLKGSCNVLLDDGIKKQLYLLDQPHISIFIDQMIWHEMHDFSEDCVLLVIASDYYNKTDYLRDYQEFLSHKLIDTDTSLNRKGSVT
ncbi:FdtA/QdtA family cupin domain-containing protein [Paenisporosarcina sp. TG20]|uniref:sugar 3,4-ketoisomerase n=1 Tax=Paenisporosarcina sp. TG20 TaxID=1211706 RepID=UPI0002E9B724|nr:FdtA/QdtA family cupin domain-containing protein [Paenisporosarcina sp. TG20]